MVFGLLLATGASLTASVLVLQVAVLPLMFRYNKTVQRKVVFSNCINFPRNLNYDSPSSCSVTGGRNLNIEFRSIVDNCLIRLGIWHILPNSEIKDVADLKTNNTFHELKNSRNPVILYCHGNSNHRASPHRLKIYSVFQELNFHVVTFDYRGYGDSTKVKPTERGVVEDLFHVYSWLLKTLDLEEESTVFVWGHSLGTAVAANFVSNLEELCQERGSEKLRLPDALVLEAPFNNLKDEIAKHPLSKLVSWLPYFKNTFVKPFTDSPDYSFTTDEYLAVVPDLPILMLHSKGDRVVPYELAVKLQNKLVQSRKSSSAPFTFQTFEREHSIGHNNLCEAKHFKSAITDFLRLIEERKKN
ncbi:monoacylglycerol lipase ABHD12-like [Bombyx mandarina]|uniref:Monoacylglycerol lipase ABHD12-like n=1 Tax=Bombyx mandarina TaxID=7092 RepID=A0A6J2K806_BOMMA|nr:monoacylglycerol lipase ABHD12-like [Bombyx mandarina]